MEQNEVNLVRDAALLIEDVNLELAYDLMCLAGKYRSDGQFIKNKIHQYKKKLQVNNGLVNIHFGVHKTATTYIQKNLELITDKNFHYNKLSKFRKGIKSLGYLGYLRSLDWNKKVVISDENMIGNKGTILTGALYPNFKTNINKYLFPFNNRDLVNVFLSIRPMTSFLPSLYCEYLRWNKYISYKDFTSKVDVNKLSWFDVLHEGISCNKDLNFYIFDFCKFDESKHYLLNKLSFGLKSHCDQSIKRSRASFTYREISRLSNGGFFSDSDKKFDPHTEEEKKISLINYENDFAELIKYSNVII